MARSGPRASRAAPHGRTRLRLVGGQPRNGFRLAVHNILQRTGCGRYVLAAGWYVRPRIRCRPVRVRCSYLALAVIAPL